MPTFVDANGQFTEEFRSGLPTMVGDDLWKGPDGQPTKAMDDIRDVAGLAKSYVATKRMLGSKAEEIAKTGGYIKVPGANATPAELAAYRQAIGAPGKPEEYEIAELAVPQGVQLSAEELKDLRDEGFLSAFKAKAHELGLPKAAVKALAAWYDEMAVKGYVGARTAQQKAQQDAKEAADRKWNEDWSAVAKTLPADPSGDLRLAIQALRTFADPEMQAAIQKAGLWDKPSDPALWKQIGRSPSEIAIWLNIGKRMQSGFALQNDRTPGGDANPLRSMYPNSPDLK